MKLKFIFASFTILMAFASCQKCVTCVPYHYSSGNGGVKGAIDNNTSSTSAGHGAQEIKLCDKTDIKAYESLTNFTDAQRDTVRFYCN